MPEELDIRKIKEGLPGITKIAAGQLYEACMVCLHRSGHPQNVIMPLKGDNEKEYEILWEDYLMTRLIGHIKIRNTPQNTVPYVSLQCWPYMKQTIQS